MSVLDTLTARALDLVDLVYETIGAIARVAARGAFAADNRSYRSGRFKALAPSDVLMQDVMINAADETQARRVIDTDPERYLALEAHRALFDVVGPIDDATDMRAQPERRFKIGAVRRETLERARGGSGFAALGGVEAFVARDPARLSRPMIFRDEIGIKQRRVRRLALAISLLALTWTIADAGGRLANAIDVNAAQAKQQRALLERRIQRAAREEARAAQSAKALAQEGARPLSEALTLMDRLAARVPPSSGVADMSLDGAVLTVKAKTYDPAVLELELRRGFESASIDFTGAAPGALTDAEARLRLQPAPPQRERAP